MALFLEFDEQLIRNDSRKQKQKLKTSAQCSEKILFDLARTINAQQSALTFEQSKEDKVSSKMNYNIILFESFSALITIEANNITQYPSLKLCVLEKGTHCCLKSSELLKSVLKRIRWIQSMTQYSPTVYTLDPYKMSLCVKFKANIMVRVSSQTFLQAFKPLISLIYNFTKSFTPILLYISNLLPRSSIQFQHSPILRPLYNAANGQLRQYAQIYQILPLVNSPLHIQEAYAQRNSNLHCIIDNFYSQKRSQQIVLYTEPLVYCSSNRLNNFEKGFSGLTYPTMKQNTNQRKFLFNSIRIRSINKNTQRNFAQGGKSKILLNTISFIYTDSFNLTQSKKIDNGKNAGENSTEQCDIDRSTSHLEKSIAIKVPKGLQGSPQWVKFSEKIEYEKKILSNFRGTSCAYFPKYYQSIQPIAQLNDTLLMDYVQGVNLGDFIDNHKDTCSFSSKLQILYHISNGLRFLSEYEVAHLDLSPNNIIVVKDLLVKIIDFGQAYQPKTSQPYLSSSNQRKFLYTPGRTFPYAPPETSQRAAHFTTQQDIFSMGVLAFHLLFGSLPINCSNQKIQKIYQNKMVNNHIMLAPERGQSYGQWEFMNIIYTLLIRMMDSNELKRPQVIWTHIILKKLFYTLK